MGGFAALFACGFAALFACGFFEFWGVEFRFLIIFSEEFAKLALILARDNSEKKIAEKFRNRSKIA